MISKYFLAGLILFLLMSSAASATPDFVVTNSSGDTLFIVDEDLGIIMYRKLMIADEDTMVCKIGNDSILFDLGQANPNLRLPSRRFIVRGQSNQLRSTAEVLSLNPATNYSFKAGEENEASGYNSVALGKGNEASGDNSVAMGRNCISSSDNALAIGNSSTASGDDAVAIGDGAIASGDASAAFGFGEASGDVAFASGLATASGEYSTAMGEETTASGLNSTAIGRLTIASGNVSTAMGYKASTNSKEGAFVYGDRASLNTVSASADNEVTWRAAGGFRIFSDGSLTESKALYVEGSTGDIGIGDNSPNNKLYVKESVSGSPIIGNHVSLIENSSNSGTSNILALKAGYNTGNKGPASSVNFTTFFDGNNSALGAIEGNGSGGVTYKSGSADFAEYLPRLNRDEVIEAGDIVALFAGKISKSTENADQVLVVSTAPLALGNDPGHCRAHLYEKVAFLGQVPVKVKGKVNAGDFIVASGHNNGIGYAVAPALMNHFETVVGVAWESSNNPELKLINTAVGLDAQKAVLQRQQAKIAVMAAELDELKANMQLILQNLGIQNAELTNK